MIYLINLKEKEKMSLSSNKKGSVLDILMILIGLLILSIGLPIVYYAFNEIEPDMVTEFNESGHNVSRDIIDERHSTFPGIWDAAIVFFFFALWASSLIGAFFLDTHPIFFIISVFMLIPILFAAIVLNNFYIETAAITDLLFIESSYPMSYYLMSNSFVIMIFVGCSILVALYAKVRNG